MSLKNYTTIVPVIQTVGEIQEMLKDIIEKQIEKAMEYQHESCSTHFELANVELII